MKKFIILATAALFLFAAFAYASGDANMVSKDDKKVVKKVVKKKTTNDPTVYIKPNGKKFHKKNCHLVKDKKGIKLSEAKKMGLTPCAVCKPLDPPKPKVKKKVVKKK